MQINFTENEKEYIDMIPFNWKVREGCPKSTRSAIERKLKLIKSSEIEMRKVDNYG